MFQHCLICTDFTDGLQRTIHFVSALQKGGFNKVTFFHSVPIWSEGEVPRVDREKIAEMKAKLSPALENIPDGMEVNVEVLSGSASDNIIELTKKYDIDFIITGSPLSNSLENFLFGSTTSKLTKKVHIPIMVLRPQLVSVYREEELSSRLSNLNDYWLVPYQQDYAHAHDLVNKIKEYAQDKSQQKPPKCLVLTTVDDVSRSQLITDSNVNEAKKKLAKVKEELESVGVEVETIVKTGNHLEIVFDAALTYNISAIAIANDRDSKLIDRILDLTVGNDSSNLLNCSWFPIVYFPLEKAK